MAEKRVWSGLQSLLVLASPAVVGGVNGGNVICYCLIVTRAISVVLNEQVLSHIKSLWDRQKVEFPSFSFNQRFQNEALCTSTWSVKKLPLLTLEIVSKREEHKQQKTFFSKDKYHHEIKVHVAINLYTTRLNYKHTRLQT